MPITPCPHRALAASSRIGDRAEQQDRCFIHAGVSRLFLMIADGLGGHAGGRLAASTLKAVAKEKVQVMAEQSPGELFTAILLGAHERLKAINKNSDRGFRSTVVMACIEADGEAYWAHVGDSRLYWLDSQGQTILRTRDHTAVDLAVHTGELTAEEALNHPNRSLLYRSVGWDKPPKAAFGQSGKPLEEEGMIVLCSDGFWEQASPSEIPELMHTSNLTLQAATNILTRQAVARAMARADNTTVVTYRHSFLR